MDMNETNLTIVDYRDVEKKGEVKRLYRKAFPREERAPWLRLMRAYNEWDCAIEAYYHGKTFIGFTVELERTEFLFCREPQGARQGIRQENFTFGNRGVSRQNGCNRYRGSVRRRTQFKGTGKEKVFLSLPRLYFFGVGIYRSRRAV